MMLEAFLTIFELLYLSVKVVLCVLFVLCFMLIYAYCLGPAGYETLYRIYIDRQMQEIRSSLEDGVLRRFLLSDMVSVSPSLLLSRLSLITRRARTPRQTESDSEGGEELSLVSLVDSVLEEEDTAAEDDISDHTTVADDLGDRGEMSTENCVTIKDEDPGSRSVLHPEAGSQSLKEVVSQGQSEKEELMENEEDT